MAVTLRTWVGGARGQELFNPDGGKVRSSAEIPACEVPEDRRVSHGCIRLTNEAACALMHAVRVGTPVLVYRGVQ